MTNSEVLAIGVDIGGTDTKLGLVDSRGAIRQFDHFPSNTSGDPRPFLREMVARIGRLRGQGRDRVCGIGLSVHGYVDAERRGPIVAPHTPELCGLDLRSMLENAFGLPVVINADLTAHVLAEYHYGSGRGSRRFLCLAVGTGLGAGVVINGQALRYLGGCAGDTGHVILQPGGPRCAMGCRGCAEALCGGPGIERLARERLGRDLPAHKIISGAHAGEPSCVAIIEQIGAWLGQTLATLCAIYLPDRVALSGGVSEAGPALLAACEQRFYELVGDYHQQAIALSGQFYSGVTFVLAEMRGQTGVAGAVAELFHQPEASVQNS